MATLIVRDADDIVLELPVESDELNVLCVGDIMRRVSAEHPAHPPANRQRLVFAGRALQEPHDGDLKLSELLPPGGGVFRLYLIVSTLSITTSASASPVTRAHASPREQEHVAATPIPASPPTGARPLLATVTATVQ